jgi:hypothetical protein
MTRRRVAAVWFAVALLPLAGCGNDSGPAAGGGSGDTAAQITDAAPQVSADAPAGAPDIDPCSLVSNEEMAGILSQQFPNDEGAVTVTSEIASGFGNPSCTYTWTRSTWGTGAGKEFTIALSRPNDLEFTAGFGERIPIGGVGDEAFVQDENYFARVGDTVVHLTNLDTPEASVAVLTAAAGHL